MLRLSRIPIYIEWAAVTGVAGLINTVAECIAERGLETFADFNKLAG
jgi:hypothetical protein